METNSHEKKIGEYVRDYFTVYFADTTKTYDITNFLNKYWCNEHLGICYPLLKEIDEMKPVSEQKNYNNEYARYWIKPVLEINGKHFLMCSQWFKGFQSKLDAWISEQDNTTDSMTTRSKEKCDEYDFKKNVCMCSDAANFMQPCEGVNSCTHYIEHTPIYIIPKIMSKHGKCPSCGLRTQKEFLVVTYKKDNAKIINKLPTTRCEKCERSYISDTIYGTYTKNKNVEDLDVKFIPITKLS